MPDLDLVRETYASLPEEKLIRLARADKTELTEGAYQILMEEFQRRGMDINDLPGEEKIIEDPEAEMIELAKQEDKPDYQSVAISYKDRMMIRSNWFLFLFCILLGIGVLLMLDKIIREGGKEKPAFAFVMIFIGLLGLIVVLYRKRVYKKQDMRFDFEKEKKEDEKAT